jgi:hypothetical protein
MLPIIGNNIVNVDHCFGGMGIDTLGKDVKRNDPVKIDPGELITISYNRGLCLPGITSLFLREYEQLKDEILQPYGRYKITSDLHTVGIINKEFNRLYGNNLAVRVHLFSNNEKPIKTFTVKLDKGETIFERNGNFEHDIFLGESLSMYKQLLVENKKTKPHN